MSLTPYYLSLLVSPLPRTQPDKRCCSPSVPTVPLYCTQERCRWNPGRAHAWKCFTHSYTRALPILIKYNVEFQRAENFSFKSSRALHIFYNKMNFPNLFIDKKRSGGRSRHVTLSRNEALSTLLLCVSLTPFAKQKS